MLGIIDISSIADTGTASVPETTPILVTPPVLNALPTVLDVVKLDSTIGSKFQNLDQGNTIDLSDYAGTALKVDITTQGEAAYTNNIGFYVVEDAIGTIKLADGTSLKLLGNNNFGVEDMYGGGDRDFNDLVVKMNIKIA